MGGFISAPIVAALTPVFGAAGASVATGIGLGAAAGAGVSALTGGNVGKGALGGAITGGAIGLGPALGITGVGGTTLLGAAGGALGAAATGGNVGRGAVTGAASGLASGLLRGPSGAAAGSAEGAGATAQAGGVSGGLPVDLTSQYATGGGAAVAPTAPIDGGAFNPYPTLGAPTAPLEAGIATPSSASGDFTLGGAATTPFAPSNVAADLGVAPQASGDYTMGGAAARPAASFDFQTQPPVGSMSAPRGGDQATRGGRGNEFVYQDSTLGQVFDSLGLPQNTVTTALAKNPGALVAGGGLAYNMLANSADPNVKKMQELADQMNARGERFAGFLENGTLPPGAQTSLNQAAAAAKAKIRSDYARMGMAGSTAETQDLNAVDERMKVQGFQMAAELLRSGLDQTGIAARTYAALLGDRRQQRASTGSAIANFAAAMGGGGLARR